MTFLNQFNFFLSRLFLVALAIGWCGAVWATTLSVEEAPLSIDGNNPVGKVFPALADFFEDYQDFLASQDEFGVRVDACRRNGGASENDCVLDQLQAYRVEAADLLGRSVPAVQEVVAAAEIEWVRQNQQLRRSERSFAQRKAEAETALQSVESRIVNLAEKMGNGEGRLTSDALFEIAALRREWEQTQTSLRHWELHSERLPEMRQSLEALEQLLHAIEDEVKLVEHAVGLRLGLLNDFESFVEIDVDVRETVAEFNRLASVLPRLQEVGQSMFEGIDLLAVMGEGSSIQPINLNFNNNDEVLIAWLREFAQDM